MSFFNLVEPNEFKTKFKSVISDEYWVKNPEEGAVPPYIPLAPGGGGGDPTPLPYYLKENEIRIENGTTGSFSIMDPAFMAIDGGTEGTILSKDSLTFVNSDGNGVLNKPKIDLLSQIKTDIVDSSDITTINTMVVWNPVMKNFEKNPVTSTISSSTTKGITFDSSLAKIQCKDDSKLLNLTPISISTTTGTGATAALYSEHFNGGYLSLTKSSYGTKNFYVEDINVTNKLKALASKVVDANSKMMIYDATAKTFNYSDIPAGSGTSYAYNQSGGIYMNIGDFPTGVQVNGSEAISTVLKGDTIKMIDLWNDGGAPAEYALNFAQFKHLSKIGGKQYKATISEDRFQNAAILGVANDYADIAATVSGSYATAPYFSTFNTPNDELFIGVTSMSRNKWYGIRFPKDPSGGINTTYSFKVYPSAPLSPAGKCSLSDERFDVVKVVTDVTESYTIEEGTWFIRFNETREVPTLFNGTIHITCKNQNQFDLPDLAFI